ncbi:MAG: 3-phosphoglycerate dehydrogenase family protein [Defluviitaleaceae bacterium]|nr:3-phosphoglycerate dehydrogenase family protein [Defluviitaleaceae bacterium]
MHKILTLNKIAECGIEKFPKENFAVSPDEKNPDGIILRSYAMEEKDLTKSLLAVGRAGAGTNNIPVDKCTEKGIVVFNTPGANANAVKELVVAGLLLSSRRVVEGIDWVRGLAGQEGIPKLVEKGKADFAGPEILGKKLGVFGLGATGGRVANACAALGMEVIGFDPYLSPDAAWSLSPSVRKAAGEDALYAECDYLSIHAPATDETKHKFGAAFFAKCKKGVRIMNFSRAELFDNDALKAAISDGTVACYVTDFPTDDLVGFDKVIAIPHLAASTPESEDNCAAMAAEQLREYLLYGNIKNSVNFPDNSLFYGGLRRVCVLALDGPGLAGEITAFFANKGIKMENVSIKSRGGYAYAIIETSGDCADFASGLESVGAVIRARVL